MEIEKIINELVNSEEYKKIEYRCLTIRKDTSFSMYYSSNQNKKIDKWMQPFYKLLLNTINQDNIDYNSLIYYMLDKDNIKVIYFTLLNNNSNINIKTLDDSINSRRNLIDLFKEISKDDICYMLLIYILDNVLEKNIDIDWILKKERFTYERNSYNLTKINGCWF